MLKLQDTLHDLEPLNTIKYCLKAALRQNPAGMGSCKTPAFWI